MSAFRTMGFHHITMVAEEAERTAAFYGDLLGLTRLTDEWSGGQPGPYPLVFGDEAGRPGTLLTFLRWSGSRGGRWGVGGVHHVALGVESEESQLKWKRRLMDAGVGVTGPYDRGYFTSIYFADPDGQIVEIATAGPGYLIDESLEELGRELKLPPERLLRGHRDEAAIAALTWPEPISVVTADMRLTGLHHVSGLTDDLELALDWYPAALGLDVIKRTVNRDDGRSRHYFWGARSADGVVPHSSWTLFGWPGSSYRARAGVGQTHHVAFRAEDEDHLVGWRDHLLGMSVDVTPVRDRGYFRSVYFRSPDGQLLEISTDGPGTAVEPERWESEPLLAPTA